MNLQEELFLRIAIILIIFQYFAGIWCPHGYSNGQQNSSQYPHQVSFFLCLFRSTCIRAFVSLLEDIECDIREIDKFQSWCRSADLVCWVWIELWNYSQCSNNYGGALGGFAFAKGLHVNKSLRVSAQFTCPNFLMFLQRDSFILLNMFSQTCGILTLDVIGYNCHCLLVCVKT